MIQIICNVNQNGGTSDAPGQLRKSINIQAVRGGALPGGENAGVLSAHGNVTVLISQPLDSVAGAIPAGTKVRVTIEPIEEAAE